MKILAFTKYSRLGASSRLRTLQFIPLLEEKGFEFDIQSLFDDNYLENLYTNSSRSKLALIKYYYKRLIALFKIQHYDLIWIEYELFPYLPAFAERVLSFIGKNYIVDYDDAIFHNYDLSQNLLIRKLLSKKIATVMEKSSYVIAGNEYLIQYAKSSGAKHIKWIPTVVDKSRYGLAEKKKSDIKVIGWIGSPSTQHYLIEIKEALNTINEHHPIRLLLVGANQDIADELPDIDVEIVPWSESSEIQHIQQMDIGIMPLKDGAWEKGKCGYKLIQYMACGIPVIASPVGTNINIIESSNSGLLAKSIEQWVEALELLLLSSQKLEEMGMAGRNCVEEVYCLQVQAPILANTFHSIIKKSEKI